MTVHATRVLIVEDDHILRKALETMCRQQGFDVQTAADGEAGLRLALEIRPEIVLLDLLMPKRTGVEVLRELKADPSTAGIPVIVLSNSSREDYRAQALALGAAQYHLKSSLSLAEVVQRVRALAAGARPPASDPSIQSAAADTDAPLDFDALLRRYDGRSALVADILAGYRADMPARMARLVSAIKAGDAVELEYAAHSVNGALALIDARPALRLAQEIERAARLQAVAGIEAMAGALALQVSAIEAFLDERARNNRP